MVHSVFINAVFLEHGHVLLLMHYLWLLSHYKSRAEQLRQRTLGLQTLTYLPSVLSREMSADCALYNLKALLPAVRFKV